MKEIKKICKKDVPRLMSDSSFWNHPFLCISKHRLWAHYNNPECNEEDIIMLLAYLENELVGYMGVYTDYIQVSNSNQKIGWLSTWWVHPKTKGTGIGRLLLNTMYKEWNGKIGISQFTESAKRVYDKSDYFVALKNNEGVKAVLKSNLSFVLPIFFPTIKPLKSLFDFLDSIINVFLNFKIFILKFPIQKRLENITIEYLPFPDKEVRQLMDKYNQKDIAYKNDCFFNWLKAYNWVYEAPINDKTESNRYAFSMYDKSFEYYFVKVKVTNDCKGFLVLQKRGATLKILFTYFDNKKYGKLMADIVKIHAIKLKIREVICYEPELVKHFFKSKLFLYKKKRIKHSIISKSFGIEDFENVRVNFGDGDCAFA